MDGFPTDKTPGQGIGRGSCAKKEILIAEKARPCRQLPPDGFILAKILLKINVFFREIEQEFEFPCISVWFAQWDVGFSVKKDEEPVPGGPARALLKKPIQRKISASVSARAETSMGLAMKPSIPCSKARSRSSARALAVRAAMGTERLARSSMRRMVRVAR